MTGKLRVTACFFCVRSRTATIASASRMKPTTINHTIMDVLRAGECRRSEQDNTPHGRIAVTIRSSRPDHPCGCGSSWRIRARHPTSPTSPTPMNAIPSAARMEVTNIGVAPCSQTTEAFQSETVISL